MKQLILIFALLSSGMVFSKTAENKLANDIEAIGLITEYSNIKDFKAPIQNEIIYIHFNDDFPCTLSATVTGKVVIDGSVIEVTLSGSLQLDDCFDLGSIGVNFLRGLINDVISELQMRVK